MDFGFSDTIDIVEVESMNARMKNEFNKFFVSAPGSLEAENVPASYEYLLNLDENYYSYLSPRTMIIGDSKVNLKDIDDIKISDINKLFKRNLRDNVFVMKTQKRRDIENISEEMSKPKIDDKE